MVLIEMVEALRADERWNPCDVVYKQNLLVAAIAAGIAMASARKDDSLERPQLAKLRRCSSSS